MAQRPQPGSPAGTPGTRSLPCSQPLRLLCVPRTLWFQGPAGTETLGWVSLEVIPASPGSGSHPLHRAAADLSTEPPTQMSPGQQWARSPWGLRCDRWSPLPSLDKRDTQSALPSLAPGDSPRIWILQKETAMVCHWPPPSGGRPLSPWTSLTPSHDNIGCRGGEEAPSSRSSSRSPISCPRSHTPALVSAASSLKGRTVPPGYRAFPTKLEAESATRPSGNQRLTGEKGEVRFLPEIEVRDMGGIQGFMGSVLVLTGSVREAVGKHHSPV